MRIDSKMRRVAAGLAIAGFGLSLLGAGVGAVFTDSGSATENINVGTFGISVSSTTAGAVVVNGGNGVHTVTYSAPTIQSSAAGSAPLNFTVTSTGSASATVNVSCVMSGDPTFTDLFGAQAPVTLATSGSSHTYTGGISWPVLTNADLGQSATDTCTITANG